MKAIIYYPDFYAGKRSRSNAERAERDKIDPNDWTNNPKAVQLYEALLAANNAGRTAEACELWTAWMVEAVLVGAGS